MTDEDWNIYRGITKDVESDEENLENKLNEVDIELREIDSDFENRTKEVNRNPHNLGVNENYIDLVSDRIKGFCLFSIKKCKFN